MVQEKWFDDHESDVEDNMMPMHEEEEDMSGNRSNQDDRSNQEYNDTSDSGSESDSDLKTDSRGPGLLFEWPKVEIVREEPRHYVMVPVPVPVSSIRKNKGQMNAQQNASRSMATTTSSTPTPTRSDCTQKYEETNLSHSTTSASKKRK